MSPLRLGSAETLASVFQAVSRPLTPTLTDAGSLAVDCPRERHARQGTEDRLWPSASEELNPPGTHVVSLKGDPAPS